MTASTERLVASCGLRWFHYRSWEPLELAMEAAPEPEVPAEVARAEVRPTPEIPKQEVAQTQKAIPVLPVRETPSPEQVAVSPAPARERIGTRPARAAPIIVLPSSEHVARQHAEGQRRSAPPGPTRRFALLDEVNAARGQPAVQRERRPGGPVPLRDRRDGKET